MTYLGRDLILPSAQSAADFIDGKKGSLFDVASCTLFRGILIASGLYVSGLRGKQLKRASIFGALSIEAFVLSYSIYDKIKKESSTVKA